MLQSPWDFAASTLDQFTGCSTVYKLIRRCFNEKSLPKLVKFILPNHNSVFVS